MSYLIKPRLACKQITLCVRAYACIYTFMNAYVLSSLEFLISILPFKCLFKNDHVIEMSKQNSFLAILLYISRFSTRKKNVGQDYF